MPTMILNAENMAHLDAVTKEIMRLNVYPII